MPRVPCVVWVTEQDLPGCCCCGPGVSADGFPRGSTEESAQICELLQGPRSALAERGGRICSCGCYPSWSWSPTAKL
jgi:hypothetical protein